MNNEENELIELKHFFDSTTESIKTSALVNRALTNKISSDTINQKVNSQFNSIQASMYRINSKFNEKSRNYHVVKKEILDVLTEYEYVLKEYGSLYDKKLEKLISKKVELENRLVGKIFNKEKIIIEKNRKDGFNQNDNIEISFADASKKIHEKFSLYKNNNINFQDIYQLQNSVDFQKDKKRNKEKRVLKIKECKKDDLVEIADLEKKIKNITEEIRKINDSKRLAIEVAMETKEKWVAVSVRKPHTFTRITKFFSNKFNTSKVVTKTVINPLREKIDEFKLNELADIKD